MEVKRFVLDSVTVLFGILAFAQTLAFCTGAGALWQLLLVAVPSVLMSYTACLLSNEIERQIHRRAAAVRALRAKNCRVSEPSRRYAA